MSHVNQRIYCIFVSPGRFKISPSHLNWPFQGRIPCLSGIITFNFFCFLAVGGESTVSTNLYPKASNEQLKVHGYDTQFPGRKSLKACSIKYGPTENSYEIFISYFRLAIPFKYKEEVETNHISMHKYWVCSWGKQRDCVHKRCFWCEPGFGRSHLCQSTGISLWKRVTLQGSGPWYTWRTKIRVSGKLT